MTDQDFVKLASKLKCNTGNELDVIGMKYETSKIILNIYGEMDNDHTMIIDQALVRKKGKWSSVELSEKHLNALERIFKKEVERAKLDNRIKKEANEENEQYARDVDKYGMEGALYSKFY